MWEGQDYLSDLDFADDIALIADSWSSMQQTTTALTIEVGKVVLCTNPEKCKILTNTVWNDRTDIQATGSDIEKVDDFCYLVVVLAKIQPLLEATRRPQQSGFTAGRSTVHAILTLRCHP